MVSVTRSARKRELQRRASQTWAPGGSPPVVPVFFPGSVKTPTLPRASHPSTEVNNKTRPGVMLELRNPAQDEPAPTIHEPGPTAPDLATAVPEPGPTVPESTNEPNQPQSTSPAEPGEQKTPELQPHLAAPLLTPAGAAPQNPTSTTIDKHKGVRAPSTNEERPSPTAEASSEYGLPMGRSSPAKPETEALSANSHNVAIPIRVGRPRPPKTTQEVPAHAPAGDFGGELQGPAVSSQQSEEGSNKERLRSTQIAEQRDEGMHMDTNNHGCPEGSQRSVGSQPIVEDSSPVPPACVNAHDSHGARCVNRTVQRKLGAETIISSGGAGLSTRRVDRQEAAVSTSRRSFEEVLQDSARLQSNASIRGSTVHSLPQTFARTFVKNLPNATGRGGPEGNRSKDSNLRAVSRKPSSTTIHQATPAQSAHVDDNAGKRGRSPESETESPGGNQSPRQPTRKRRDTYPQPVKRAQHAFEEKESQRGSEKSSSNAPVVGPSPTDGFVPSVPRQTHQAYFEDVPEQEKSQVDGEGLSESIPAAPPGPAHARIRRLLKVRARVLANLHKHNDDIRQIEACARDPPQAHAIAARPIAPPPQPPAAVSPMPSQRGDEARRRATRRAEYVSGHVWREFIATCGSLKIPGFNCPAVSGVQVPSDHNGVPLIVKQLWAGTVKGMIRLIGNPCPQDRLNPQLRDFLSHYPEVFSNRAALLRRMYPERYEDSRANEDTQPSQTSSDDDSSVSMDTLSLDPAPPDRPGRSCPQPELHEQRHPPYSRPARNLAPSHNGLNRHDPLKINRDLELNEKRMMGLGLNAVQGEMGRERAPMTRAHRSPAVEVGKNRQSSPTDLIQPGVLPSEPRDPRRRINQLRRAVPAVEHATNGARGGQPKNQAANRARGDQPKNQAASRARGDQPVRQDANRARGHQAGNQGTQRRNIRRNGLNIMFNDAHARENGQEEDGEPSNRYIGGKDFKY